MKWIIGLVVAQSVLIILILLKLDNLTDQNQLLAQLIEQKHGVGPDTSPLEHTSDASVGRRIAQQQSVALQRELTSLTHKIDELAYHISKSQLPSTKQKAPTIEQQSQQDILLNELNNLVYTGSISQGQLETIQIKAASLHPSQRKHMFHEISRAINSGELDIVK